MKASQSFRMLAAAGLCSAALLCAACNDNTPPATAPMPSGPGASLPPAMPPAMPPAVTDAVKVAQAKLDEVSQYIKDNKLDSADKALSALEADKASLPVDIQNKLPELRTLLDAAKAKAGTGLKLPGT